MVLARKQHIIYVLARESAIFLGRTPPPTVKLSPFALRELGQSLRDADRDDFDRLAALRLKRPWDIVVSPPRTSIGAVGKLHLVD